MLNEYDIDSLVEKMSFDAPEIEPYARYLADWKDIVNQNSDGWCYWKQGTQAANKLMALIESANTALRTGSEMPSIEDFKKSLSSIKRLANRKSLPVPELKAVKSIQESSPRF